MAARRYSDLSASYRARFEAYARRNPTAGTPAQIWRDPELRAAATGHEATPRSPLTAFRAPDRYPAYVEAHWDALHARLDTARGRRTAAAAREATVKAGGVPVSLQAPSADEAAIRKTFMTASGARNYLADNAATMALVQMHMAWVVPDLRPGGGLDWDVWIYRVTP